MQLATGQRGFQHVARIHGTFRLAGANHGMQLVDEQNDVAFLLGKLVEHRLQALLELAPELGASNQRAHIQRQDALVLEPFRHLTVQNALGQTFDDGGLADAGFADQHRVVLGTTLQHLHRPTYLIVPADDRVELALLRPFGQIDRVLGERFTGVFRVRIINGISVSGHPDGLLKRFNVYPTGSQHPAHSIILEHGQQYLFR